MNPEISTEMTDKDRESASKAMRAMADIIDDILNGKGTPHAQKQYGLALLVYPMGQLDRDHINYIGSGKREDVLTALKELTARWETRQ